MWGFSCDFTILRWNGTEYIDQETVVNVATDNQLSIRTEFTGFFYTETSN
jgi:hypothetical protein